MLFTWWFSIKHDSYGQLSSTQYLALVSWFKSSCINEQFSFIHIFSKTYFCLYFCMWKFNNYNAYSNILLYNLFSKFNYFIFKFTVNKWLNFTFYFKNFDCNFDYEIWWIFLMTNIYRLTLMGQLSYITLALEYKESYIYI
jgi:hypothetical protein